MKPARGERSRTEARGRKKRDHEVHEGEHQGPRRGDIESKDAETQRIKRKEDNTLPREIVFETDQTDTECSSVLWDQFVLPADCTGFRRSDRIICVDLCPSVA